MVQDRRSSLNVGITGIDLWLFTQLCPEHAAVMMRLLGLSN